MSAVLSNGEARNSLPLLTMAVPIGSTVAGSDPKSTPTANASKPRGTAIQRLMRLADQKVLPVKSSDGSLMAARKDVPHLVYPLSGLMSPALVPVFLEYENTHGKPAPKDAMSALRTSVEMHAAAQEPQQVFQRSAWVDGVLWIDCGWADGSVYRVSTDGWEVVQTCPVLFSRSAVTAAMPDARGVTPNIKALEKFVNCVPEDLPLVWAVLITAWFSDVPQPIFSLLGGADSGKSTAMRFLIDLVDPSTTQPGGTLEKDPRNLKAIATIRRVMCFDNVSRIDQDTSDLLARIATGGEISSRALYSNDTAHITQLMRPVWLNGIMDGFQRGDLASRAVRVELLPVAPRDRVSTEDLQARWNAERAQILAGLLALTVEVLRRRKTVTPSGKHRNAEFERNLLCIDDLWQTSGADRLEEQAKDLAQTVLDSTAFGMAWRRAVEDARMHWQPTLFETENGSRRTQYKYTGPLVPGARDDHLFQKHTAQELMAIIQCHAKEHEMRYMPTTTKDFGEKLRHIQPQLEACLSVSISKPRDSRQRYYVVRDLLS